MTVTSRMFLPTEPLVQGGLLTESLRLSTTPTAKDVAGRRPSGKEVVQPEETGTPKVDMTAYLAIAQQVSPQLSWPGTLSCVQCAL